MQPVGQSARWLQGIFVFAVGKVSPPTWGLVRLSLVAISCRNNFMIACVRMLPQRTLFQLESLRWCVVGESRGDELDRVMHPHASKNFQLSIVTLKMGTDSGSTSVIVVTPHVIAVTPHPRNFWHGEWSDYLHAVRLVCTIQGPKITLSSVCMYNTHIYIISHIISKAELYEANQTAEIHIYKDWQAGKEGVSGVKCAMLRYSQKKFSPKLG